MTTTNFIDKQTVIEANWANDADAHIYDQVLAAHQAYNLAYIASGTDAVATTVKDELDRTVISSLRFMSEVQRNDVLSTSGGLADVSSPLQKWFDYLMTKQATGKWIAGNYLHSTPLLIQSGGVTLQGQGTNTKLIRTGDFGDSIVIRGTSGAFIEQVNIFDILIDSRGLTTSGALLTMDGLRFGEFRGIRFRDGFEQIRVEGATQLQFRHVYGTCTNLYGGSPTGRKLCRFKPSSGNSPSTQNSSVYMSDYNFSGSPASPMFDYALALEQESDGHFLSNGHVGSAGIANVLFDETGATSGHNLNLIFISNFMSDKCFGTGITFRGGRTEAINGNTILLSNWQLRGGTTGTNGIHIESDANFSGVAFANFQIDQFSKRAFHNESDLFRHYSFVNPMFMDNSLEGVSLYSHVEHAAACGYGSFLGGRVGGKPSAGGVAQNSSAFKFHDTSTQMMIVGVKCNLNSGNAFEGVGDGTILVDCPFLDEQEDLVVASATTTTIPLGHDVATVTGTTDITTIKLRPHETGPLMIRWAGNFTLKNMVTVAAGSFSIGQTYIIRTLGQPTQTDFTAIGAASNTVGLTFTATGVGAGNGTASIGNLDLGGNDVVGTGGLTTCTLICESRTLLVWVKVASTGENKVFPSVTAATSLTLPTSSDNIRVNGNTNIDTIVVTGNLGRHVRLQFTGTPTLSDGAGNLKLAGAFAATADDTISLMCDGVSWFETGRSVN